MAWSAGSFARSWHVVHAGGDATPFGPWGRWHVWHPLASFACGPAARSAWHEAQAACGVRSPEWGTWHASHFAWPAGALAFSFAWHVPHAGATRGVWVDTPWHVVQSECPRFVETSFVSRTWHPPQVASLAFLSGGVKSCALWQLSHAVLPACADVSVAPMVPWQDVQAAARAFTSPVCGAWHAVHAVFVPCFGWTPSWHPSHDAAALPGEWGVWQLVQAACAVTSFAPSVGLTPWHPTHALEPPATKSWGLWQVRHES